MPRASPPSSERAASSCLVTPASSSRAPASSTSWASAATCSETVASRRSAPSCSSPASRLRCASAASTIRRRDAATCSTRSCTCACSRTFATAMRVAAATASSTARSWSAAGSWTSTATRSPSRSIGVTARADPAVRDYERTARLVDVARVAADPVAELERPVAERAGEAVAQRHRFPQPAEIDHQAGQRPLRPAPPQQVGHQAHGDESEHDLVRPQGGRVGPPPGEPPERAEGKHRGDRQRPDGRDGTRPPPGAGLGEVALDRRRCHQDAQHERRGGALPEWLDRPIEIGERHHRTSDST